MKYIPSEIIKKKRNGKKILLEEIDFFVTGFAEGIVPEYQMSALLMAIYFQGLDDEEILNLTKVMINSGKILSFSHLTSKTVDKHSTGGVGDKTSLILAPIVAAAGVPVPMISGRGLGHTGGTLDKLESIPGFQVNLSLEQFVKNVSEKNLCFIGQTHEICPADKKMYALRDVTGTVESRALISASIMSKKLAEGTDGLVLDVKWGNGAFLKDKKEAIMLAQGLVNIARGSGRKVQSILSNMNQPLGRFAGNALEVQECIDILSGKSHQNSQGRDLYSDTRELSLVLASYMIWLGEKANSVEEARKIAEEQLNSGQALNKFKEICYLQGGDLKRLPSAKYSIDVRVSHPGYLHEIETEKLGILCIQLHAGRTKIDDPLDPTSGFEIFYKTGDFVQTNDVILRLYGNDESLLQKLAPEFRNSLHLKDLPVNHLLPLYEVLEFEKMGLVPPTVLQ